MYIHILFYVFKLKLLLLCIIFNNNSKNKIKVDKIHKLNLKEDVTKNN